MDYYFYNTDARSIIGPPSPRFRILIDRQFAAVGGDRRRFGEQFHQLKKDDVLLMYEDKVGVVAVGRVLERWDGKSYTKPWYYTPVEMGDLTGGAYEYRIKVEWFPDLSDNPITLKVLRQRFGSAGFTPRGAVKKIVKYRPEIERMLEELRPTPLPMRAAIDLAAPASERVETRTYRILRDTAKALYIKDLHEYQCQVCGHTIELPDGKRYAEAHHIRPLGAPHNGPDVIGNILCVCPNHHAELDYGVSAITVSALRCSKGHTVDPEYVDYHNQFVYNSATLVSRGSLSLSSAAAAELGR